MYHLAHINLSENQMKNLAKGKGIQLHAKQLHHPSHQLIVHNETAKKLAKAHRGRKGTRIQLSPHEIESNVQGGFLPMLLASAFAPALGDLAQGIVGKLFG